MATSRKAPETEKKIAREGGTRDISSWTISDGGRYLVVMAVIRYRGTERRENTEKMTPDQISTMVALVEFGHIFSTVPSSYLMDAVGRKITLLLSGVAYIAASVAVILGTEIWQIYLARVMAGFGKGICFVVVPIYLAEIANNKIRGALSAMFVGFLNMGVLFDYVLGPYLHYNMLNGLNIAIPILFLLTMAFLPESPYYQLMKGREDSARRSLIRYSRVEKSQAGPGSPLDEELKSMSNQVEEDMKMRGRFIDLFGTASNRRALLIISVLAFFQRSSGIGTTIAFSTTIMPKTGGGAQPAVYMMLFSVVLVLANYLAMPLVDRVGRKPLLAISSIGTAIVTCTVSGYYLYERNTSVDVTSVRWIPYAGLISFAVTYSIGIGFLPSTLVGELFPTNVKSYAGSVSAIIMAAVSFSVHKVFQAVTDTWGVHVMYWYFTVSCLSCAIFVHFFVFETKGKSFGEVQAILKNTKINASPM